MYSFGIDPMKMRSNTSLSPRFFAVFIRSKRRVGSVVNGSEGTPSISLVDSPSRLTTPTRPASDSLTFSMR